MFCHCTITQLLREDLTVSLCGCYSGLLSFWDWGQVKHYCLLTGENRGRETGKRKASNQLCGFVFKRLHLTHIKAQSNAAQRSSLNVWVTLAGFDFQSSLSGFLPAVDINHSRLLSSLSSTNCSGIQRIELMSNRPSDLMVKCYMITEIPWSVWETEIQRDREI